MDDEDIREVFAPLGPISIRRMFSGKGVYFQGVIIAIVFDDELRLKADLISAPEFEAAGSTQWAYEGRRGKVMMPYWSIPNEALDDPDSMARWVRLAFDAGLRAQAPKTAIKRRPTSPSPRQIERRQLQGKQRVS